MFAPLLEKWFKNFNTIKPVYESITETIPIQPLPESTETLVIGGGLLGLSTALSLGEAGHDTVLIESNNIGDGASGRSGGQLWPGFGMGFSEMLETYGVELTKETWDLNYEILEIVHRRIRTRNDMCDFTAGLILTSKSEGQRKWIEKEFNLYQKMDIPYVSFLAKEEINNRYIATNFYFNGILFKGKEESRQYGHVNPLKYTQTVAKLAHQSGVKIIENCSALQLEILLDGRYSVRTSHGEIKAKNIVFATGVDFLRPSGVSYGLIPKTNVPAQNVILATEPISKDLANEIIPSGACFCDASEIAMNFVSLLLDHEHKGCYRLTFGGADALMQAEVELEIPKIEKEMYEIFPQLRREGVKVAKIWGGRCDLSRNGNPMLINPRKGIYHASGFSGQGMVNTALYGSAISDKILCKNSGKFELLEKINPPAYSRHTLIAWLQAAEMVAKNNIHQ